MNINKLITSIFRNRTIFWDILKYNRGQTNCDRRSITKDSSRFSESIYLGIDI